MHVVFSAGTEGAWRIDRVIPVVGNALPGAERLSIAEAPDQPPDINVWSLRGFTSNGRYSTRSETDVLRAKQPTLSRASATCGALIPIKKTAEWWALAQDERRAIFEEQSRHSQIGLEYLPGVARRLHHCRDLDEPFDFLTWFEFAPADEVAFDQMLLRLRATLEWKYVEREVEVRVSRKSD